MNQEQAVLYLQMLREFFPEVFSQQEDLDPHDVVATMRELADVACEVLLESAAINQRMH